VIDDVRPSRSRCAFRAESEVGPHQFPRSRPLAPRPPAGQEAPPSRAAPSNRALITFCFPSRLSRHARRAKRACNHGRPWRSERLARCLCPESATVPGPVVRRRKRPRTQALSPAPRTDKTRRREGDKPLSTGHPPLFLSTLVLSFASAFVVFLGAGTMLVRGRSTAVHPPRDRCGLLGQQPCHRSLLCQFAFGNDASLLRRGVHDFTWKHRGDAARARKRSRNRSLVSPGERARDRDSRN